MVWDFVEGNVLGKKAICWSNSIKITCNAIETVIVKKNSSGTVLQLDVASDAPYSKGIVVSTDPPYYDNIGYADLSDFFYVWLRHSIGSIFPDICSTLLAPKIPELVAAPERFDNDKEAAKRHFLAGFCKAFKLLKDKINPNFPLTVYYAFKQSDDENDKFETESVSKITLTTGWETMLEALITSGFQITGTWPVSASSAWRLRSRDSNALASYIVLVCRPLPESSKLATRREFTAALRRELPIALRALQHGNIAPVDFAQAAIGPGMSIYSRYSKVLEADGRPMSVRTALQTINQELDAYLTAQEGYMDTETRFCAAWFEQFGLEGQTFGEADVLARAKNTAVSRLVEEGVLYAAKGKVRLLSREELNQTWNPETDRRRSIWMCTQQLVRALNSEGEKECAKLAYKIGNQLSESTKSLAYRLYSISERKGWTDEALAYNSLVISWPSIQEKVAEIASSTPIQLKLFE
ncbi:MAG: DUF1156 domain-containing protein [Firmicutes bacterium]|nr:DUF1156 domain-containing protein [Bacillota bacterium]